MKDSFLRNDVSVLPLLARPNGSIVALCRLVFAIAHVPVVGSFNSENFKSLRFTGMNFSGSTLFPVLSTANLLD